MKGDGLAEDEAEGYFASISDLMVGVLFVFLLMMVVLALNFRDDSQELVATRQQMEAAKAEAEHLRVQNAMISAKLREAAKALKQQLADREQIRAALLERLAIQLRAANINFVIDPQSGVLRLSDAIPFKTGRSDLSEPEAQRTVQMLSQVLSNTLPCFSAGVERGPTCHLGDAPILETMLVEGHTDTQQYASLTPVLSEAENDRLSTERALTVFAAVRQQAPVLDHLKNETGQPLLGVSGYGQRRPLPGSDSSNPEDLTRNRRIDLRFVLSSRNSQEIEHLLHEIDAILPGPAR
jgi:flagellar motor protein MotB